jgi:uncharacterized protein (DUF1697 family)
VTRYVALLRGINVGGNNLIRMPALKACFEALGFDDVATYIQSGNVLFSADGAAKALAPGIERALTATFAYQASIVLRSARQMQDIVRRAPAGFGGAPGEYRYDVLFLKEPLTAAAALKVLPAREGVDEVHGGPGVLYYSRLISRATQSRLSKVASMPIYRSMTVRNWNTTTKLLALLKPEG